jgi:hypothetical protein
MTRCELNEICIDSYVSSKAVTWSRTLLKKRHLRRTLTAYLHTLWLFIGSIWFIIPFQISGVGTIRKWRQANASHMRHTCVTVPWLCHVCAMCIMSSDQFRPLVLVVAKTRHGCRRCRRSAGSSISNFAFWSPLVQFTLQCDLKQTIKSQFKPPFT